VRYPPYKPLYLRRNQRLLPKYIFSALILVTLRFVTVMRNDPPPLTEIVKSFQFPLRQSNKGLFLTISPRCLPFSPSFLFVSDSPPLGGRLSGNSFFFVTVFLVFSQRTARRRTPSLKVLIQLSRLLLAFFSSLDPQYVSTVTCPFVPETASGISRRGARDIVWMAFVSLRYIRMSREVSTSISHPLLF